MSRKRYLIIGDGAAGLTAAAVLRQADAEAVIGIFSDEPVPGYYRAALTNYLLGELREDQLFAVPPDFYERRGIHRIYTRVVGVDSARSLVWCSTSPEPTGYDHLLIASGARARAPTFEGAYLPGVLTLRSIADARQVYDAVRLHGVKTAVVLGGGALGLEWAHALLEHGVKVTLIERAPRFMPGALDEVASDLLATRLRKAGIDVILGDEVRAVHPGPRGGVAGISLASGRSLPCEIVAAALGVVPNTEYLRSTDLKFVENGAVAVDRRLAASTRGIWAAGDVASVEGEWLALWEPARRQAHVAALNMSGGSATHEPGSHYFATRLFDLDFARVGRIEASPESQEIVDFPRGTGQIAYRKLVLEGGKLRGALMIGERALKVRAIGRNMKRLVDAAVDVSDVQHRLLDPSFDCDAWLETKRIVERPKEAPKTSIVPEAKLKRTHLINLGSGTQAVQSGRTQAVASSGSGTAQLAARPLGSLAFAPQNGGTAAIPSGPRKTKLLSIGLRAEAPLEHYESLAPLEAHLEGGGRNYPIVASVTNLGQSPECQIPLRDPALSAFHAQLLRHENAMYVRDLGSSTGTWVNGQCLFGPHSLADGDRIRIGQLEFVFRSNALVRSARVVEQAGVMMPRLEVRSGNSLGLGFALSTGPVIVGSAPDSGVRLGDSSVSPRHAQLQSMGASLQVSDLGSYGGTYARGARLPPNQPLLLNEGEWIRFGAVDVLFTSTARPDAMASLRPRARVHVDSGPEVGKSMAIGERLVIGSDPRSGFVLSTVAAQQLELATHNGKFWVRDLSGGRAFRAGRPISTDFSEIQHGDVLLLSGSVMLRFEEAS